MLALARLKDDQPRLSAFLRALDRYAHVQVLTREAADDRRAAYRPVIDNILRSETFPSPNFFSRLTSAGKRLLYAGPL